jgi:methionine-S-sulfoxide reductase
MKKFSLIFLVIISLLIINSFSSQEEKKIDTEHNENIKSAYFAGGCFWGVEYHFEKKEGVIDAISGYMGGNVENPSYYEVIKGKTGHLESVKIVYDSSVISYEALTKLFFEIHDMEQTNGQGPDIGPQYLSAVFYNDDEEKQTAENIMDILTNKGYKVATTLKPYSPFYKAEGYHQDYYFKRKSTPYCHAYTKIFD